MRISFKLIPVLILVFGFFQRTQAQNDTTAHIFGIKGSIGTGWISEFPALEIEGYSRGFTTNYNIGFSSKHFLKRNLHLGIDLTFSSRGGGYQRVNNSIIIITIGTNGQTSNSEKAYFQKNYVTRAIETPVYMKYSLFNSHFTLDLGLLPSLSLKTNFTYNYWDTPSQTVEIVDEHWKNGKPKQETQTRNRLPNWCWIYSNQN